MGCVVIIKVSKEINHIKHFNLFTGRLLSLEKILWKFPALIINSMQNFVFVFIFKNKGIIIKIKLKCNKLIRLFVETNLMISE